MSNSSTTAILFVLSGARPAAAGGDSEAARRHDEPARPSRRAGAGGRGSSPRRRRPLARCAGRPAWPPNLEKWGFLGGHEREFKGASKTFTDVISRTLAFRDPAGARAYVAFVAAHAASYYGPGTVVHPMTSAGRHGLLRPGRELRLPPRDADPRHGRLAALARELAARERSRRHAGSRPGARRPDALTADSNSGSRSSDEVARERALEGPLEGGLVALPRPHRALDVERRPRRRSSPRRSRTACASRRGRSHLPSRTARAPRAGRPPRSRTR